MSTKKRNESKIAEHGVVAYSLAQGPTLKNIVDPVTWVTDGKYTWETLKLFEDVGQLYELLLARMEFSFLCHDLEAIRRRAAYFEEVSGQKTHHYYISSVLGKGQIGHSNQYLTHWFYPYKGKFHGQMVKALINFAGVPQHGIVLDPFLGSGTTLVESAVMGIKGIGIEINPALVMVSQIKTDCLEIDFPELQKCLENINPLEIFHYFHKRQDAIKPRWSPSSLNGKITGKMLLEEAWDKSFSSGFVKDLPFNWRNFLFLCYLHALSDFTYLQYTPKGQSIDAFFIRDLSEYLATLEGTHRVLNALSIKPQKPEVLLGSALELNIQDDTIDAIVTSPPYSIALDYVKNDEHLLNYLGIDNSDLREKMVGLKGKNSQKVQFYERDMRTSLLEMQRVLKPGGVAVILLGDVVVDSTRTNFCYKILSWAKSLGFSEAESIKRPILGGYARLRYEYIIILRK